MPIKISQMTSAASLTGDEIVPLVQSGGNVRSTIGALTTFATPFFNWKSYGAIGDGASHPLSTRYATLALAQAVYPFATSLTQEIDFCAIQKSINAANAAGGGYSFGHPGTYQTGSDTLTMRNFVTLQGSGKRSTTISYGGANDAIRKAERVNSSVAVYTVARDFGISMTNPAATGGCYVDVGGTFVEVTNIACNSGKFGIIFDQTELATIRACDLECNIAGGADIWLVNGLDHTPSITLTVAPAAGAVSGTLNANWAGVTGTFNLDFTETVGGAHESRMATLTNGSTAVTWVGGLSAACNAITTAANSQFTNRILITENQFNTGGVATSGIVDDGGVSHVITCNNFNSGIIAATPAMCRFAGVLLLSFHDNYMEGGQRMLFFTNTAFFSGAGAGACTQVTIKTNIISMSQPNTPIVLTSGANPFNLEGNWFGISSASAVVGAGFNITNNTLGNIVTSGTLLDVLGSATLLQIDNSGSFTSGIRSVNAKNGYTTGAGGTVTQLVDKTTGVTRNTPNGEIVLSNAALGANTTVSFTLTNSTIAANDVVSVIHKSAGTAGAYLVWAGFPLAGSCTIFVRNITAGSLSEAIVLQFAVTAGSIS